MPPNQWKKPTETAFSEPIRDVSRRSNPARSLRPPTRPEPASALVLFARLGRAHASLMTTLKRALKQEGIDDWGVARLCLLLGDWRGPLNVVEAAWWLGVSEATASRIFDRAERFGLIDKLYPEPFDERENALSRATKKGISFIDRIGRIAIEVEQGRLAKPLNGRAGDLSDLLESAAVRFRSQRGYGYRHAMRTPLERD